MGGDNTTAPGNPADFSISFTSRAYLVDAVKVTINTSHSLGTWEKSTRCNVQGANPMPLMDALGGNAGIVQLSTMISCRLPPCGTGRARNSNRLRDALTAAWYLHFEGLLGGCEADRSQQDRT